MTVEERVFLCRLLEKVKEQEAYCETIGLRDRSRFQGRVVSQISETDQRKRRRSG